ncbi:hypothetical protein KC345_g11625, partial [Hortaea werneckii]
QASKAILWNKEHADHYVFYYGDFNWNNYAADPSAEELHTHSNLIVQKAKEYIDENYAQKGLTIHEVAKKNHVSPNYLSYLFKKNTGHNLWEYVIKLRMEDSREMILNTDLRRYEIAERVGYESPEHFSKIFKKYYGISPSELKKWSMISLVFMETWQQFGSGMLIYLAAVLSIPRDWYEAAEIDGAGVWARIRHITLPSLRNLILLMLILQVIATSQGYQSQMALLDGGPNNATLTYALLIVKYAFTRLDYGTATALGMLMFVVLGGLG